MRSLHSQRNKVEHASKVKNETVGGQTDELLAKCSLSYSCWFPSLVKSYKQSMIEERGYDSLYLQLKWLNPCPLDLHRK